MTAKPDSIAAQQILQELSNLGEESQVNWKSTIQRWSPLLYKLWEEETMSAQDLRSLNTQLQQAWDKFVTIFCSDQDMAAMDYSRLSSSVQELYLSLTTKWAFENGSILSSAPLHQGNVDLMTAASVLIQGSSKHKSNSPFC